MFCKKSQEHFVDLIARKYEHTSESESETPEKEEEEKIVICHQIISLDVHNSRKNKAVFTPPQSRTGGQGPFGKTRPDTRLPQSRAKSEV